VFVVQYYDQEFTLWDRFEVNGELTLEQFLQYFQVWLTVLHVPGVEWVALAVINVLWIPSDY